MTSTIGVKKIQHTNGTQVMTFDTAGKISSNVSSTGDITTTGTITTPSINGGQIGGRRNLIINGAMMVAQRGTSTQFSNANGLVCDRFECANQTDGAITFSQSTDVPSGQGFINSTKINVDTADTSLAATQHALFQQKVEGLHSSHLMWGTSNAQNVTVSFWIKSSLTGTFTYYVLDQGANSQSYVQTFTIDSANTWEKKTFTIAGPTTGGTTDFPITNARSFYTGICLGVGSTHQTSTTGSWHSTANFAASTSSAVKLIGTASANMYVTGWQIELGNQVTAFEHRSFGEELALCQRYYFQFKAATNFMKIGHGRAYSTTNTTATYTVPVPMRANPTGGVSAASDVGVAGLSSGGTTGFTTVGESMDSYHQFACNVTRSGGDFSAGTIYQIEADNNTNMKLTLSAEL